MKGKSNLKKLISKMMILAMVLLSVSAAPKQANTASASERLASTYLNASTVYLHLGNPITGTFNFNINEAAVTKGATFFWYVKMDKGNPDSAVINPTNGIVTAMEAGTAYIRCKITLANGTVLRPEAKVVVRNNITEVDISNLPENMTIKVGEEKNFNRVVLNTEGGKGKLTHGITRWEITDDTAGIGSISASGIVKPTKEGEFKIRAICFQSDEKFRLWSEDKVLNEKYITTSSKWYTILVKTTIVTPAPTPTSIPIYGGGNSSYTPPVNIPVSSIDVTGAGGTITVVRGEALQMNANVMPSNATNKTVTWSVAPTEGSGAGTAVINASTGLLTGTGIGTVTVTATADNGVKGNKIINVVIGKQPIISNVSISSNSAKGSNVARNGDIITLQFTSDEPVTKLGNFKINGSNPDTFTNEGNVYRATHLVDSEDVINGLPVTFQINVQNAKGVYSVTVETTTNGSSVTIVDEKPVITDVRITSNNANNTKAMTGDIITLTFKSDEPVTKLSNFKINGSNPDTFTNVGNVYTATHLVDAGDLITGEPVTFQINVKNGLGIYSLTVEETTDGSSVTIIDKMPRITNVSISSNSAVGSDVAKIGDIITLQFTADEPVTKLSNFKINGSNPDTFTNVDNVYTATHLVDAGDPETGMPVTFQINVKNAAGIYSYTIESTSDGSSVTIIGETVGFHGTVYASDFDRDPANNITLEGAKVTLTKKNDALISSPNNHETTTDSEGKFNFNYLVRGTYILEVTKDGYVSYINDNFMIDDTINTMNIYLDAGAQTATLTGIVTIADEDTIANNNLVLPNITVSLTKIGSSTTGNRTTVTDSNGKYTFTDLACGLYEIIVSGEGYITIKSNILITSPGTITYNITLEAISNSYAGTGTAKGAIINALTGSGVEAGLTLSVFAGYNLTEGAMVTSTTTGDNGEYSFVLQAGNYTVNVTDNRTNPATRYNSGTFIIKVLGNKTIDNQNGQVTPILSDGEIRIVLSWGETPSDLDSHLTGPTGNGDTFHVYFDDEEYYEAGQKMANLDVDDVDSYGPETTTIYSQEDGIYKFSIHDYSDRHKSYSMELANSGASIKVYMGNNAVKTYYVPHLEGTVWDVFEYNSVTGTFADLNQMSYIEDPSTVAAQGVAPMLRTIAPDEKLKGYELAE